MSLVSFQLLNKYPSASFCYACRKINPILRKNWFSDYLSKMVLHCQYKATSLSFFLNSECKKASLWKWHEHLINHVYLSSTESLSLTCSLTCSLFCFSFFRSLAIFLLLCWIKNRHMLHSCYWWHIAKIEWWLWAALANLIIYSKSKACNAHEKYKRNYTKTYNTFMEL